MNKQLLMFQNPAEIVENTFISIVYNEDKNGWTRYINGRITKIDRINGIITIQCQLNSGQGEYAFNYIKELIGWNFKVRVVKEWYIYDKV